MYKYLFIYIYFVIFCYLFKFYSLYILPFWCVVSGNKLLLSLLIDTAMTCGEFNNMIVYCDIVRTLSHFNALLNTIFPKIS